MTVCKTCKAPVLWARNIVTGKMQILDATPDQAKGNIIVDPRGHEPRCQILDRDATAAARGRGDALYLSHFATCPDAATYRRRGTR